MVRIFFFHGNKKILVERGNCSVIQIRFGLPATLDYKPNCQIGQTYNVILNVKFHLTSIFFNWNILLF